MIQRGSSPINRWVMAVLPATVRPLKSVDKITVGEGRAGPLTLAIQKRFMEIVRGEVPDQRGWLDVVKEG